MEISFGDSGTDGTKTKTIGVGLALLVGAVCLLDFVYLRGELVESGDVYFSHPDPIVLAIDRMGEPHLVEISTSTRRNNETRGLAVKVRLLDPNGIVVHSNAEVINRKSRNFRFTPTVAGDYQLEVEDNGMIVTGTRGSARVAVYVNDRRFLPSVF